MGTVHWVAHLRAGVRGDDRQSAAALRRRLDRHPQLVLEDHHHDEHVAAVPAAGAAPLPHDLLQDEGPAAGGADRAGSGRLRREGLHRRTDGLHKHAHCSGQPVSTIPES